MSEILPPDALLPIRQYLTFVGRNTEPHEVQPNSPFDMIRRLVDSHEALRAGLAAAEERAEQAEREAVDWQVAKSEADAEWEAAEAQVAALVAERDEQRHTLATLTAERDALARIQWQTRERVATLTEALRKYAGHTHRCATIGSGREIDGAPQRRCTCGLDAALAAAPQEAPDA